MMFFLKKKYLKKEMKQLTCEMCGGTDLIKDGGVFVCQTCGCKYSIEEAIKEKIAKNRVVIHQKFCYYENG